MKTEYAVFGAGYGRQILSERFGSGHIAYQGESLAAAEAALKSERKSVARLRRQASNRNAADTYAIYKRDDSTDWLWVAA